MLAMIAMTAMVQTNSQDLVGQVDSKRLKANVEKLASWHDRNTNNPTLTEAVEWIAGEYRKIPGMQVEIWKYPVKKGARIREDKDVVELIATLPGATDRRVLIGGHLDTINMSQTRTDPSTQWTLVSPGADDDASGACMA